MTLQQRKKIILAILEKMGGRLSAIQMQKYLFLYTKLGGEKIYDFVPYRYGCFSFQANKDILSLSNDQLVSVGKDNGKDVSYQLNYKTNALESLDLFTQDTIGILVLCRKENL